MDEYTYIQQMNPETAKITGCRFEERDRRGNDRRPVDLILYGKFDDGTMPRGELIFYNVRSLNPRDWEAEMDTYIRWVNACRNPVLKDIRAAKAAEGFTVRMELEENGQALTMKFRCDSFGRPYEGIDYSNVYDEVYGHQAEHDDLYDEDNSEQEETKDFGEGISRYMRVYRKPVSHRTVRIGIRCELRRDGKPICTYANCDGRTNDCEQLIHHADGHRYFAFKEGLYGICYLDVDTLEEYRYVPRGYYNNYSYQMGESFIITGIHYDERSNLVAYSGCYWASSSDVKVGRLDDPIRFEPYLVSIHDLFDPDYDNPKYEDIDFVRWEEDGLIVQTIDKTEEKVGLAEIGERIDALKRSRLQKE